MARRFTPLYRNSISNKISQQVKQRPNDITVTVNVVPTEVLAVGSINKFHIDDTLSNALRAIGVADEPAHEP